MIKYKIKESHFWYFSLHFFQYFFLLKRLKHQNKKPRMWKRKLFSNEKVSPSEKRAAHFVIIISRPGFKDIWSHEFGMHTDRKWVHSCEKKMSNVPRKALAVDERCVMRKIHKKDKCKFHWMSAWEFRQHSLVNIRVFRIFDNVPSTLGKISDPGNITFDSWPSTKNTWFAYRRALESKLNVSFFAAICQYWCALIPTVWCKLSNKQIGRINVFLVRWRHLYTEAKQNPVVRQQFYSGEKMGRPGWAQRQLFAGNSWTKHYIYCLYGLFVGNPIPHYNCPAISALVSLSLMSLNVNIHFKAVSDCLSSQQLLRWALRDIPRTALETISHLGHIHDIHDMWIKF